jgi:hypothetical protein
MYRPLETVEAARFVEANNVRSDEVPSWGLLVDDGRMVVLVFRKTTGELKLVDVSDQVPPHFAQKMPATPSFWQEFARLSIDITGVSGPLPQIQAAQDIISAWQSPALGAAMNDLLDAIAAPAAAALGSFLAVLALGAFVLWKLK